MYTTIIYILITIKINIINRIKYFLGNQKVTKRYTSSPEFKDFWTLKNTVFEKSFLDALIHNNNNKSKKYVP